MDHRDNLRERVDALEGHLHNVERRLRWWRGIALGAVMLGLWGWALPSSTAKPEKQEKQGSSAAHGGDLEGRLAALEFKLLYVSGGANEVVITGANLRIVNGLGITESINGLGNLIVGYNEPRPDAVHGKDDRSGSHNIVLGIRNNFSSAGGFVGGDQNEISGSFASVVTGSFNTASGPLASIAGGIINTASGIESSVCGGQNNTASGTRASISGGNSNTADGFTSAVSGGLENAATGSFSSVSGGHGRAAPGDRNWAAGPLFADF